MRRFSRHLFTIASAASLVWCVLICLHWWLQVQRGREYEGPRVQRSIGRSTFVINLVNRGDLRLFHTLVLATPRPWPAFPPPAPGVHEASERAEVWERGGFTYYRIESAPKARSPIVKVARVLIVPLWAVAAALVVLPLACATMSVRRFRRRLLWTRRGLCPQCGYDLRGGPQRCPECGKDFAEGKPRPLTRVP